MALMEAGTSTGEVASGGEPLQQASALAIDIASMSDAQIEARLAAIAAQEARLTDTIDVHQSDPLGSGIHIGLSATRGVVAPLSGLNSHR